MEYLFRSMLFLPGHNCKYLEKAATCDADALILDLEDAVPEPQEEEARAHIREYLEAGRFIGHQVFVRVNELGTNSLEKDLELLDCPGIIGIVPPKISTADDLRQFDDMVSDRESRFGILHGSIKLLPLIETAAAILNAQEIARSSNRLIALLFGGEDYLDDVWGKHFEGTDSMAVPRAMVVMAARANGLIPIDTPYLDLRNEEGYKDEERRSAAMGFAGHLLLTPIQIPWAHECFTPSEDEISQAKAIMAAIDEARRQGGGIAKLDGKMIGPPMRKRAEKVYKISELIKRKNEQRRLSSTSR